MPEFCRQISFTLNDRNQNGMGFNYHRGHFLKAGSERYRVILPHNPAPIVRPVHLRTGYGHITLDKWCSSHLSCLLPYKGHYSQAQSWKKYRPLVIIFVSSRGGSTTFCGKPFSPPRHQNTKINFSPPQADYAPLWPFSRLLRVWISAVIIMAEEFFY